MKEKDEMMAAVCAELKTTTKNLTDTQSSLEQANKEIDEKSFTNEEYIEKIRELMVKVEEMAKG